MLEALMQTYARLPVTFERGDGAWLTDSNGERYLDALSGIGVCSLGHSHPVITHAVAEQAKTLMHTSNLYRIPLQERLASRLCEISGMASVFFANSGAEANETAIKLARLYGRKRNIDIPTVMVMDGGFHGRTLATLSATGNRRANVTEQSVIRLLPPLIITDEEAQQITHTVIDLIKRFLANGGATRRG